MPRLRSGLPIALLVAFLILPLAGTSVLGHHREAPLQAGAMQKAFDWSWCTFNFLFEDDEAIYIGTVAHCTSRVGERASVYGIGEIGTVVFRNYHNWNHEPPGTFKDFALVRIDDDKRHLTDAAMRLWGGPVGVETDFAPGTITLGYGQGAVFSATEPTRGRIGVLNHAFGEDSQANGDRFQGWYTATHPVMGGDSGGALLTAEGRALGVVAWAAGARGEEGYVMGQTFVSILEDLHAAGLNVELVTAPFRGSDAMGIGEAAAASAVHCVNEPGVGLPTSDACVREPLPWPWDIDLRVLGPGESTGDDARPDWTVREPYFRAIGAAVGTPSGAMGAATNTYATVPAYATRDAAAVTVTVEDASSSDVFFVVCIHRDETPGTCSEHAGDSNAGGFNRVTLREPIPAETWVAAYVYTLYAGADGRVATATEGVAVFQFEAQ